MIGWQLVTTDGTSLLGGDDRWRAAGQLALLAKDHPELKHPHVHLRVPDEEIGHGLSSGSWRFGAIYGFTVDRWSFGEFCYETFN